MGTKPVGSPSLSRSAAGSVPTRVNEMVDSKPAPDTTTTPDEPGRIHRTLDAIRANPTGRVALKVTVGVFGAIVVAIGIALIPLPGPGWAIVILGLAIWAIEFVWARHLLQYTRKQVSTWTHWVGRQSLLVRAVIGAVGLVFISAVVWLSVRMTLDVDLFVVCRDFVAGG
jgi:uncharacterized protein (TIGR02611 family)